MNENPSAPARVQEHHRLDLQRQERSASTSSTTGESAAKKRQCGGSHRSKERDEYATRILATGGWPGRGYDLRLKNSWGYISVFFKECRIYRPDANHREHCKGERQCGEDIDWRKKRRESCYCQGIRGNLDYVRLP